MKDAKSVSENVGLGEDEINEGGSSQSVAEVELDSKRAKHSERLRINVRMNVQKRKNTFF